MLETRVFVPTPQTAGDFRAVIRAWPDLHALVQRLQADNLFPGLRGLQIAVTAAPERLAAGVVAALPQNAPQAPKSAAGGGHAV